MIRRGLAWSLMPIGFALAFGLWGWLSVGPEAQVPVHWGPSGQPDRYGSRLEAFGLVPAMGVALSLVFAVMPLLDPRGRNLARSGLAYLTVWLATLSFMALIQLGLVLAATGVLSTDLATGPLGRGFAAALAALFLVIGNVLGKARPNWFFGVRTPWTLSSDQAWDKTHRWTGRIWTLIGLAGVAAAFLAPPIWAVFALVGAILASAIWAVVYSYLVWRADSVRETRSLPAEEP